MKKLLAIILAFSIAACFGCSRFANPDTTETSDTTASIIPPVADTGEAVTLPPSANINADDTDVSYNENNATKITFNGSAANISGSGASASGSVVTITGAGDYILSGKSDEARILVSAGNNDDVRLILSGLDIATKYSAPINAISADNLFIIIADGTENNIKDERGEKPAAQEADPPGAAIYASCDMSISGGGSLTVSGTYKNGIGTKDDLVFSGASVTVTAVNHGVKGNDSFAMTSGLLNITAGADGIQTENTDTDKGNIIIGGGVINISSGRDAIQAENSINILGGTLYLAAGKNERVLSSESYKGLDAKGSITISGGEFNLDCADDCINSNADITISSGNFSIASGDDGIHADATLDISGGNINVTKSYEGIEGSVVNLSGGVVNIIADEDGLNAAGGMDGGAGGMFGQDGFRGGRQGGSSAYSINITGGELVLYSGGDGIDSNGAINISGGKIISIIDSSADNGALDCDGTLTVTGGVVVYGGTGIGGVPAGNSTQSYIYKATGGESGNYIVTQNENEICSFTLDTEVKYLAVSAPGIVSGEVYEISFGGTTETITAGTGGPTGFFGRGGRRF